jgi:hypothetical protein
MKPTDTELRHVAVVLKRTHEDMQRWNAAHPDQLPEDGTLMCIRFRDSNGDVLPIASEYLSALRDRGWRGTELIPKECYDSH